MSETRSERPVLNDSAARSLDSITRLILTAGFDAARLTYESESWRQLGFDSFEDWVSGQPKYQLTRPERRGVVAELREVGMTQRQIAATVGVSQSQVQRDLDPNGSEPEPEPAQTANDLDPNGSKPEPEPAPAKEGKPRSKRTTVTEARRTIKSVQLSLAGLGPLDVVPDARPVLREFAGWLIGWSAQWSEDDVPDAE